MNRTILLSGLALLLLFTSCNDDKLAKQLDGAWTGGYTTSFSDGSKEHVTEMLSFNYNENSDDDNGTFVEMLSGKMSLTDIGGWDGAMTCQYRSRIKGRWEVLAGDLYLYYNISSLEVEVNQGDIDFAFDNSMDELDYEAAAMQYTMTTYRSPKAEIAKESKKEIYESLFIQYQQHDDDEAFIDLKVSETSMSFDTSDMGRITFQRVHTGKSVETDTSPVESKTPRPIDADAQGTPRRLSVQSVEYEESLAPQGGNTYVPANMLDGNQVERSLRFRGGVLGLGLSLHL